MALSERLKWILEADNKSAVKGFQEIGATADKELGKAEAKIDKLGGGLTKFGAGAMAFAGLAGAGLIKLGSDASAAAIEAGKFSDATGLSVEAASRWIEVAGDMGIESSTLEKSLGFMNKTLGAAPEKFAALGVEIVKAKDGTTDVNATFLAVVDRLNAIDDPQKRATEGAKLLGRGWQEMAELVRSGSGTLKTSLEQVSDAKVTTPEELARAKDFRAAIDQMKDAFQDLAINIGQGVAPVIATLAKGLGTVVDAFGKLNEVTSGAAGQILGIGTAVIGAAGAFSFIAGKVILARDRFDDLFGKSSALKGGLEKLGFASKKAAVEVAASQTAATGLGTAAAAATPQVEGLAAAQKLFFVGGALAAASVVGGIQRVREAWGARDTIDAIEANREALEKYGVDVDNLTFKISEGFTSVEEAQQTIIAAGGTLSVYDGIVVEATNKLGEFAVAQDEAAEAVEGDAAELAKIKGHITAASAAREADNAIIERTTRGVDTAARQWVAYGESLNESAEAEDDKKAATERHRDAMEGLRDKLQAVKDLEDQRREDALTNIEKQRAFEQSIRDMNAALGEYNGKAAVSETETANMAKEIYDAALDYGTLTGAAEGSDEAIGLSIESLQGVADTLDPNSPLRVELLRYIEDLKKIPARIHTEFTNSGAVPLASPAGRKERAAGGPADAGETYLVGEEGPELLHMGSRGGTVIPNHALVQEGRMVPQRILNYNVAEQHFHNNLDVDAFAAALNFKLAAV